MIFEQVRSFLHSHDNRIEYNEIHHAMEMLVDGSAIYILGAGAGKVIRRNYVHHLVAPMILQCALRTDGGQTDTLIAENLIYKCTSQGIMLKLNNRCENNIVADIIAAPRGYRSVVPRKLMRLKLCEDVNFALGRLLPSSSCG